MLSRFRVIGRSMEPNFRDGDYVLVNRLAYLFWKPKVGDAVICRRGTLMLKRVAKTEKDRVYVTGDNKPSSRFSVGKSEIVGKVLLRIRK